MSRVILGAASLLFTAGVLSPVSAMSFSADTVQRDHGQDMRTGKIFIGKAGNTRIEFRRFGRPIVHIIRPDKGTVRVLYPLERSYMEFKASSVQLASRDKVPCLATPLHNCKKIGDARIAGIKVERWASSTKGTLHSAVIWWDQTRKLALRREYSDGRTMQAVLLGNEKFHDRAVERWELVFMAPNNRYRRVMVLYSLKLQRSVLELGSNGSMRELRNIEEGALDDKLFDVPKNYKRIETLQPQITKPAGQTGADQIAGRSSGNEVMSLGQYGRGLDFSFSGRGSSEPQGRMRNSTGFIPPALRAPFAYPSAGNQTGRQSLGPKYQRPSGSPALRLRNNNKGVQQ